MGTRRMFIGFLALSFSVPSLCLHGLIEKKGVRSQLSVPSKGLLIFEFFGTLAISHKGSILRDPTPRGYDFSYDNYGSKDTSNWKTNHVKLRPFWKSFLTELQKVSHLYFFINAEKNAAEPFLEYLSGHEIKINPKVLYRDDLDKYWEESEANVKDVCGRGVDVEKTLLLTSNPREVVHRSNALIVKEYIYDKKNPDVVLSELLSVLLKITGPLAEGAPLTIDDHPHFWMPNTAWEHAKTFGGLAVDVKILDSTVREAVKIKLLGDDLTPDFSITLERRKKRRSILYYTKVVNETIIDRSEDELTFIDVVFRFDYKEDEKEIAGDSRYIHVVGYRLGHEELILSKCEWARRDEEWIEEDDIGAYNAVRQKWNKTNSPEASSSGNSLRQKKVVLDGFEVNIKITDATLIERIEKIVNKSPKTNKLFSVFVNEAMKRCETFYKKGKSPPLTPCVIDVILEIQFETPEKSPKELNYIQAVLYPNELLPPRLSELRDEATNIRPNQQAFIKREKDLEKVIRELKKENARQIKVK